MKWIFLLASTGCAVLLAGCGAMLPATEPMTERSIPDAGPRLDLSQKKSALNPTFSADPTPVDEDAPPAQRLCKGEQCIELRCPAVYDIRCRRGRKYKIPFKMSNGKRCWRWKCVGR